MRVSEGRPKEMESTHRRTYERARERVGEWYSDTVRVREWESGRLSE